MTIAIITDSTCDLGPGGEVAYQIDIVPLLVAFGEKVYRDGVDISAQEFYARLASASLFPSTSQPAPAVFQALFRRRLDEGKEILCILFSSALSGTFQSAMIARSGFTNEEQQRIVLIDSMHGSGNLALLVIEACRMRDQGFLIQDIHDQVISLIPRVRMYAVADTLKYLKMGGRLSAAAALAGELLLITPVLTVVNGRVAAAAKVRRSQNAFRKWLREKLLVELPDPKHPAVFIHGNNAALTAPLKEEFKYLFSRESSLTLCLGSVVGAHAGPDAFGLCYIAREK